MITYAAGLGASIVVWISEFIRDEHRQALEWLNQRTDTETHFFGIVVEVIQIDDSRPAYIFKTVVYPNEWGKIIIQRSSSSSIKNGDLYMNYFQDIIDELRVTYGFTGAKKATPYVNGYFFSSGTKGVRIMADFADRGKKARVALSIDSDDSDRNNKIFDYLTSKLNEIEMRYGCKLEWEALENRVKSRISIYTEGSVDIEDKDNLKKWHIKNLLKMKEIFSPLLQEYSEIESKMTTTNENYSYPEVE